MIKGSPTGPQDAGRIKAFAPRATPKLVVGGPVAGAVAVSLAFIAAAFLFNRFHEVDRIAAIPGTIVVSSSITAVRSPHDASIAEFYVSAGEQVQAGQLIARLDNSALDAEIALLREKAAATRAELVVLKSEASAALKKSRLSRLFSSMNTTKMAAQIADIDKVVGSLLKRIVTAEEKVARAKIYAEVTGSIELIRGVTAGASIRYADAIARIVDSGDRLRVRALLPKADRSQASLSQVDPSQVDLVQVKLRQTGSPVFSPGDAAKVILTGRDGRRYGPFDARLLSTSTRSKASASLIGHELSAQFEFIKPRSQIAKQIELQSQLHAEILIKSGEQNLMGLLFGAIL